MNLGPSEGRIPNQEETAFRYSGTATIGSPKNHKFGDLILEVLAICCGFNHFSFDLLSLLFLTFLVLHLLNFGYVFFVTSLYYDSPLPKRQHNQSSHTLCSNNRFENKTYPWPMTQQRTCVPAHECCPIPSPGPPILIP